MFVINRSLDAGCVDVPAKAWYNMVMADHISDQTRSDARRSSLESWKFTDAKAQLSKLVQRALEGRPQRIVRGGRQSVVVISEQQYAEATAPRRNLVDLFSALRGSGLELERDREFGRETLL
jgi:prevent-host-death family protein